MKTILVPTDFSRPARHAALYAIQMAKNLKAKVYLFHVYYVPVPVSDIPMTVITPSALREEKEAVMKKEIAYLKKKTGIAVKYKLVLGFPVDEILAEAINNRGLVVMGMKGSTGRLSEAIIGSVSTTVMRKSRTPVLIIPEKSKYKRPATIVYATDSAESSKSSRNKVNAFAKTFDAKIYLLNVKKKNDTVLMKKAAKKTDGMKGKTIEPVFYYTGKSDLVDGINEFVKKHKGDWLVVMPHQHNLLERLFRRSISKRIAFHSKVPVLAIPDSHKSIPVYFL